MLRLQQSQTEDRQHRSTEHVLHSTSPPYRADVFGKKQCQKLFECRDSIHPRPDGHIRDFYDTASYHRLCDFHGGEENLKDDIFIAVSTDGFHAFKRKSYDIWPIIGTLCNLPPNMRFAVKNVLPFAFIPGPNEPTNLQSFLKPLVRELQETNKDGGVKSQFYDGSTRKVKVHLLWFTGDLPAVKKCSGLKGHNAKCPCRFCLIVGVWSPQHRHYYYPSRITSEGVGLNGVFDPNSLDVRIVGQTWQTLSDIDGSSGAQGVDIQLNSGISERALLFDLPNILPYKSFPIKLCICSVTFSRISSSYGAVAAPSRSASATRVYAKLMKSSGISGTGLQAGLIVGHGL